MLVAFQALNNIIAHRLLIACCGVLSDHYRHQTTNNFKKLLKQENAKNILKMATLIFLIIGMHIGPTRLLEVGSSNTKYNSKGRFYKECIVANWCDHGKIEKTIAADDDEDDDKEAPGKKK